MRHALFVLLAGCSTSHHGGAADPDASGSAAPDAGGPQVQVVDGGDSLTIKNGDVSIVFDKATGTSSFACDATPLVKGAYASADLGGTLGYVKSVGYAQHAFVGQAPVHDAFGDGVRVTVSHVMAGRPTIHQTFTLYPAHPTYFLLDETVDSTDGTQLASNYLGAMIVDPSTGWVAAPDGDDRRILDAPWDNDEWVRWDARAFGGGDFTGQSYELTALYGATGGGLVVGSVAHDFWKTGIYYDYDSANHRLRGMNVFGGAATRDAASLPAGATYGGDGTHDFAAHGKQVGTTLHAPQIFVGCSADWRDGLEEYGRANALVAPPRTWAAGAPVGWMSWGAFGMPVTASQIVAASNFLVTLAPFTSPAGVFVDIDAGFQGDATCATQACVAQKIHANGQRAGTYRTPFSYWGTDLTAAVPGTTYTYADVVLRDDSGNPIRRHNAYMLDVTHPGAQKLIASAMQSVVTDGFDLVKLDFLSDGAMEGRHFDPNVHSGIQAYNQAMAYVDSLLPPTVFVSESIAPMFPSQYAHARRISTDVVGQLNDSSCPSWPHYGSTEYMLDSLTFAWWMQGNLYAYNDPDGAALVAFKPSSTATFPDAWARARVTASAIAGGMLFDTTDTSSATGAARARTHLGNAQIDAIATTGRAFRPLDGAVGYVSAPTCDGRGDTNAGSRAAQVFVRADGPGTVTVAAFDYDATQGASFSIDLARLGLDHASTYRVEELWTGTKSTATGSLAITLSGGESEILAISPM